jgi:PleD family two-component response regulator
MSPSNDKTVSVLLVDDDEINNFISIKLIKKALTNSDIMACLNGKYAIDQLAEIQSKDPAKFRIIFCWILICLL